MRVCASLLGFCLAGVWALTPISLLARQNSAPHSDPHKHADRQKDFARFVEIPGAETVGNSPCLGCHGDQAKSFRHSTHSQQDVKCEDCHGAGSLHAKGEDAYGKIIKFKEKDAEAANGVCLSCHDDQPALENWSSGSHHTHDVRCVDCHRVHVEEATLSSRMQRNQACESCHRKQEAESDLPYHHPIREAKMSCADCHDPHGGTASNNLRTANLNELCFQCHAEYQGPFTFQHAPVTESCAKCHSSHGSMQRNLLLVSEPTLCLQCHAGHHNGSGVPLLNRCTSCHSAIHGTDTNSATGGSIFIDKP